MVTTKVIWLISASLEGSKAQSLSFKEELGFIKSQIPGIKVASSVKLSRTRIPPLAMIKMGTVPIVA